MFQHLSSSIHSTILKRQQKTVLYETFLHIWFPNFSREYASSRKQFLFLLGKHYPWKGKKIYRRSNTVKGQRRIKLSVYCRVRTRKTSITYPGELVGPENRINRFRNSGTWGSLWSMVIGNLFGRDPFVCKCTSVRESHWSGGICISNMEIPF